MRPDYKVYEVWKRERSFFLFFKKKCPLWDEKNKLKSFMDKQVQDDASDPISTFFFLH